MSLRIGLNGAGRIGRALLRQTLADPALHIVHVNDTAGAASIAHLLRHDSVHGAFPVPVSAHEDALVLAGRSARFTAEREPDAIPWERSRVELVVEATGWFTRGDAPRLHLVRPGVRRVLVTAVADAPDATVVLGPHDGLLREDHQVVAAASCTTHAAAIPLWLLEQWYGIEAAEMTTVHCTTASQTPMDAPHPDLRRARSALLSLIPTTTSAARGLVAALPFLEGRLSCLAIRVPTATVSLVEIVAHTRRPADPPPVLAERLRAAAATGPCAGYLGVSDEPLVSIDFKDDPRSSIIDLPLLERPGERLVRLIAWYDNEWGYTARLVDLLRILAGPEDES